MTEPPLSEEAVRELAASIRTQVMDRVKGQEQLVLVMATLIGVATTLASTFKMHSEVAGVFAIAFSFFALLTLRQDQEITNLVTYLLDERVFRDHARAQAGWERFKLLAMQAGGLRRHPQTVAQVVSIYALPLLASLAFAIAAVVIDVDNWLSWLCVAVVLSLDALYAVGAREVVAAYRRIGGGLPPRGP
jgi:hypothetical protein